MYMSDLNKLFIFNHLGDIKRNPLSYQARRIQDRRTDPPPPSCTLLNSMF